MCHVDPITREEIKTPCLTDAGSLYELTSIIPWLEIKKTDPLTCINLKTYELLILEKEELFYLNEQQLRDLTRRFWRRFWKRTKNISESIETKEIEGDHENETFLNLTLTGSYAKFKNCKFINCSFALRNASFYECNVNELTDPWSLHVYFSWIKKKYTVFGGIHDQKMFFYEKVLYATRKKLSSYFEYLLRDLPYLPYNIISKVFKRKSYFERLVRLGYAPDSGSIENSLLLKYSTFTDAKTSIMRTYLSNMEKYEEAAFLYLFLQKRNKKATIRKIYTKHYLNNENFQKTLEELIYRINK